MFLSSISYVILSTFIILLIITLKWSIPDYLSVPLIILLTIPEAYLLHIIFARQFRKSPKSVLK